MRSAARENGKPHDESTGRLANKDTEVSGNGSSGSSAPRSRHSPGTRGFFRTVADFGRQAAEALEHAHQAGIVHRAVKPGELLKEIEEGSRHESLEFTPDGTRVLVPSRIESEKGRIGFIRVWRMTRICFF